MTKPDEKPATAVAATATVAAASSSAPQAPASKTETPAEPNDGKKVFTVTPRAGPKVAGQRVKDQQDIRLTEEEAASDLLTGAIVRKGEKLHEQLLASAKPRNKDAVTEAEKAS